MDNKDVEILLERYDNAQCTPEEKALLEGWYNHEARKNVDVEVDYDIVLAITTKVWSQIGVERRIFTLNSWRAVAAALILIATTAVLYFIISNDNNRHKGELTLVIEDAKPGSSKAILTLADGKMIDLDTAILGVVASQSGIVISKSEQGQLTYKADGKKSGTAQVAINKLTVPLGGIYQVVLSDGSKIDLNAGSSLTYPVGFPGKVRNVALTGEGYFDVAKSTDKQFIVTSQGQKVKVSGTRFNISSYLNEPVRTTLLQGKVAIQESLKDKYQPLNPGQQAELTAEGIKIYDVTATDAIGWTNNVFIFTQTPIKDALTQISRWYNVKVDYSNLPDDINLVGECSKSLMLSQVLKSVQAQSKINFALKGDTIKAFF